MLKKLTFTPKPTKIVTNTMIVWIIAIALIFIEILKELRSSISNTMELNSYPHMNKCHVFMSKVVLVSSMSNILKLFLKNMMMTAGKMHLTFP